MKLNKFVMGAVFASGFASFAAMAAYTGTPTNGTIEFSGELVNSACGLSEESSPVKVNFYQIPVSNLKMVSVQVISRKISFCKGVILPLHKLQL